MSNAHGVSRRRFLSTTAAATTALGFPALIPASALGRGGASAPSERIRVGLIGCGNHGVYWNLPQICRCSDVQVVAVCDVDKSHLAEGQKAVDKHYGPILGTGYIWNMFDQVLVRPALLDRFDFKDLAILEDIPRATERCEGKKHRLGVRWFPWRYDWPVTAETASRRSTAANGYPGMNVWLTIDPDKLAESEETWRTAKAELTQWYDALEAKKAAKRAAVVDSGGAGS